MPNIRSGCRAGPWPEKRTCACNSSGTQDLPRTGGGAAGYHEGADPRARGWRRGMARQHTRVHRWRASRAPGRMGVMRVLARLSSVSVCVARRANTPARRIASARGVAHGGSGAVGCVGRSCGVLMVAPPHTLSTAWHACVCDTQPWVLEGWCAGGASSADGHNYSAHAGCARATSVPPVPLQVGLNSDARLALVGIMSGARRPPH